MMTKMSDPSPASNQ